MDFSSTMGTEYFLGMEVISSDDDLPLEYED